MRGSGFPTGKISEMAHAGCRRASRERPEDEARGAGCERFDRRLQGNSRKPRDREHSQLRGCLLVSYPFGATSPSLLSVTVKLQMASGVLLLWCSSPFTYIRNSQFSVSSGFLPLRCSSPVTSIRNIGQSLLGDRLMCLEDEHRKVDSNGRRNWPMLCHILAQAIRWPASSWLPVTQ